MLVYICGFFENIADIFNKKYMCHADSNKDLALVKDNLIFSLLAEHLLCKYGYHVNNWESWIWFLEFYVNSGRINVSISGNHTGFIHGVCGIAYQGPIFHAPIKIKGVKTNKGLDRNRSLSAGCHQKILNFNQARVVLTLHLQF